MQDNFFDDENNVRTPTFRDHDADMVVHRHDFTNTPPEEHEAHERKALEHAAKEYNSNPTAREVINNPQALITVENEALGKQIEQTAAREAAEGAKSDAEKAIKQATAEMPGQMPGTGNGASADNAAAGSSGLDAAMKNQGAEKPSSLESVLANVRLNGERQRRLVIAGDPEIQRRFYLVLQERKQLYYQGGSPITTLSRDKAIKLLHEITKEVQGASAQHAMSVSLDRDGGGIRGTISAAIANKLGRKHDIDVVVVGSQEARDAKLKELGSLVKDMERNGHVEKGTASIKDGRLVVPPESPVELKGTARLYDVIATVQDKVDAHRAELAAERQELKDFKAEKDRKDLATAKAKDDPESTKERAEPIKKFVAELATSIDKGFKDPDVLHSDNGGKQVNAARLLNQAHGVSNDELKPLPTAERQKTIVQLAALAEKADNKEFDRPSDKENQRPSVQMGARKKAETSTIREKVASFIAEEAQRDPAFKESAAPLLKDMVDRRLLTESQAEAITGRIAEAVTAAHGASAKEAPAADAAKASDSGKEAATTAPAAATTASKDGAAPQAPGQDATSPTTAAPRAAEPGQADAPAKDAGKATDAAPAGSEPRTNVDARDTSVSDTAGKTQSAPATPDLAATAGAQQDAAKVPGAEASSTVKVSAETPSAGPTPTASQAASEAPVQATEKPLELRDRIEALAKEGPAKLTEDKAHALVAELDGIRAKPLSSLDANSGEKPTQTLVRAEALLKELETGRLGPELKAQAKDLSESLQKWGQQDAARYEKDGSLTLAQRTDVVAQVKSGEPSWHGQAPAPSQPAASTSASAGNSAASESGTSTQRTAAPEKGSTPEQAPIQAGTSVPASAGNTSASESSTRTQRTAAPETGSTQGQAARTDGGGTSPNAGHTAASEAASGTQRAATSEASSSQSQAPRQDGASATTSTSQATAGESAVSAQRGQAADSGSMQVSAARQESAGASAATNQAAGSATQQEAGSARSPAPAQSAAQEQASQRLMETESAGAKLSMLMANPAGSFTNRDKSWNHENVQRAATEVLRLDPDSVSQLSAQQRTKVAVYAAWVADNANQGKLPGFASEEGKAQASQLVERAAALIGKMEDGAKVLPDIQKNVDKADRMVGAMEQLQKSTSMASEASREEPSRGGISSNAASALAKDLVHSVYRQPEMSDAQAKYLLKNAANLTPETTKSLDPQTRAQAAVAMGHLAQQVRDGAMGDFSKLPNSVQKNVIAAGNAAENLLTSMGKDPSMRSELTQAYSDLHAKNSGASRGANGSGPNQPGGEQANGTVERTPSGPKPMGGGEQANGTSGSTPSAPKTEGRSHDR